MDISKEELLIEVDEIKKLMDLLSNLFSIRASFIYAINEEQYLNEIAGNNGDYQVFCKLIQTELKHRCIACDRDKFSEAGKQMKPLLYQCYSGLYEMFLPIFIESVLVGYLHFGQVRGEEEFSVLSRQFRLDEHSNLAELEKSYKDMTVIKNEKLVLISELFLKFADIILKNKLVELKQARTEYYLKKYVEDHLDQAIDVRSAAAFVERSTSFVTHRFREIYGQTFHEYVSQARINRAKKMLKKLPISEIYQTCGFNNRYHFSKVFKKIEGVTPHEYQMMNKSPE